MKSIDFLFQELTKKEQQTISGGSSTEEKGIYKWVLENGKLVRILTQVSDLDFEVEFIV